MLINKNSNEPVYIQVINQYKRQIAISALKPHDQLPSVRKLSYDIGINPNTLQKAYAQLEMMGICYTVPGKGRFVSEDALSTIRADTKQHFLILDKVIEELAICDLELEDIISKVTESYRDAVKRLNS